MAEDQKDQDPGNEDQKGQDPGGEPETEEDQKDPDPSKDPEGDPKEKAKDLDPETKRAIQRRDRALKERDAAKEETRKLREKYEPEKADPVKVANRRLVTAESRVVMAAAGLADREAQAKLAPFLDLDSVTVDDDGNVDSDAITERLETLVELVGKLKGKSQPRIPRLDTRDRGGEKAAPKDAQSARRRSLLGYR